jgi:two-component sensor histidine kinase
LERLCEIAATLRRRVRRLAPLPPDGLTGTMSDFVASIHPADREAALAAFVQAQHPGGLYEAQFRVLHDNGVIRWLSGVGECFVGSDGRLRMVGYNVDITASKQAEASREILIDELNHRVKNLFAIAIGMVKMSARAAQTPATPATPATPGFGSKLMELSINGPAS